METRPLGQTGLSVSLISFGCVELGIPYGIGVHDEKDMLPEATAVELLHTAVEKGITFFDTAPAYGRSEAILGRAFADRWDDIVLCTKCPSLLDQAGKPLHGRALRERVVQSLEGSLTALQTSCIDVFMLHQCQDSVIDNEEVAALFADLKRQGMIRAAGASTYPGGITERVIESGYWDVIQLAFNLLDQRETEYLAAAEEAGIGVVVRSVLFKGILTDRGRTLHPALARVAQQRERCLAAAPDASSLSNFATRYAMSQPGVSSVLVGIDRMEYLEKAVAVAEQGALDRDVLETAADLAYPEPEFLDLHAWDVRGWLT